MASPDLAPRLPRDNDGSHDAVPVVLSTEAFRAHAEGDDSQNVEFWRKASPAAHARAMIELSEYAERMSRITGLGKEPTEAGPIIKKLMRPDTVSK